MDLRDLNVKYRHLFGEHPMYFECLPGWSQVLDAYFAVVDHLVGDRPGTYRCRQIKEKYGSLRIYDSIATSDKHVLKALDDARNLAEGRSFYVCEVCGEPGLLRGEAWYTVRCDEHARDRGGQIEPPTEPPLDFRIGGMAGESWMRYDPDLDLFVPSGPPEEIR